jgi:hypothetical protein
MNRENQFDDSKLQSEGQMMVKNLVSSLPEDQLSMAWRSSLNEQLLKTAAKTRRRQYLGWIARPAFGLAFAGALAAVVMIRTAPVPASHVRSSGRLEAALVQEHQQNLLMSDVAGVGMMPSESRPTENAASEDWSEVDLESL